MTESVRDALFSVIRYAMGEEPSPSVPSAEVCTELLRIAARQSILPIVYDGLRRMNASAEALAPFETARLKDGYYSIHRENALLQIRSALDSAQIPYVLLKGAVLCALYPDPDWRTSCDIDILVQEERINDAVRVIESQTGFCAKQRNYHDVSMVNDFIFLELHFSLKENMKSVDPLLTRAWEYARPTGEGSQYVFSPEYLLFHVVAHMGYHMAQGGLGIRPFLDLWLMMRKTEHDEAALRRMCHDSGILTFYENCLQLVGSWMEGAAVSSEVAALECYCLDGGVFGNRSTVIASKVRKTNKPGYVFHRLFPGKELMQGEFPELKEKPWRLPWCHFKRWARVLNKQKRDCVRQELRGLKETGTETVEAFDRLLTDLGL